MDLQAASLIKPELNRGEMLLWAGRPDARRYAREGIGTMLFAIPFTGFALVWTYLAVFGFGSDLTLAGGLFGLFGLPFIIVGAWMLSTPLRRYLTARSVVYGLTRERAVTMKTGRSRKVESIPASAFTFIDKKTFTDGRATIRFCQPAGRPDAAASWGGDLRGAFIGVERPEALESALRRVLSERSRSEPGTLSRH